MTIPTLVLTPEWNISQRTFIPKTTTTLGDNYSQIQNRGLEAVTEWDVKSPILPQTSINTLLSNLRTYSTSSFLWSPTGTNLKQCSLAGDWTLNYSGVFRNEVYLSISNKIITAKVRGNSITLY